MQTNREQQPGPEYQFNLDEVIEEVSNSILLMFPFFFVIMVFLD